LCARHDDRHGRVRPSEVASGLCYADSRWSHSVRSCCSA
jgi:hypothetical protein